MIGLLRDALLIGRCDWPKVIVRGLLCLALYTFATRPAAAQAPQDEVIYFDTDAVGSVRLVTDPIGNVLNRHDYQPFGQEWNATGQDNPLFAGKERDASGLDYSGARYFAANLGRFTAVDPIVGSPADPQSWNLYAYASNNPLRFADPDGLCSVTIDGISFEATECLEVNAWRPMPIEIHIPHRIITIVDRLADMGMGLVEAAVTFLATHPPSPPCVAAYQSGGAIAGGALGSLGFAGGPAGFATTPSGTATGGLAGTVVGSIACMGSSGGGGGGGGGKSGGLSDAVRRKLGTLADRANEKIADVIRSRGGTASNVNQAGHWANRTLREAAQAAIKGDQSAEMAIKIAKQAGRLGQRF